MPLSIYNIAEHYFDYLAKTFPIMCASDEFHFMPRAETAINQLNRIDDLSSKTIKDAIQTVKTFKDDIKRISRPDDLDAQIDIDLLISNIIELYIYFQTSWHINRSSIWFLQWQSDSCNLFFVNHIQKTRMGVIHSLT